MKTITIEIPDNCEVQIVKKEEKKECKFKKGDIIVSAGGSIAVFEKIAKSTKTSNTVVFFSTLYKESRLFYINKVECGIGYEEDCRYATSEEVNTLISALKEEASKDNKDAKIVLKEVFSIDCAPVIRTYQDLINNDIELHGFFITNQSWINHINGRALNSNKLIASSEKVAKSMLAMAMISQLMPYYGGVIKDEEWKETNWTTKYTIDRVEGSIVKDSWSTKYHFLAFHTAKQRDEFLKYNEQLVKDYLMI